MKTYQCCQWGKGQKKMNKQWLLKAINTYLYLVHYYKHFVIGFDGKIPGKKQAIIHFNNNSSNYSNCIFKEKSKNSRRDKSVHGWMGNNVLCLVGSNLYSDKFSFNPPLLQRLRNSSASVSFLIFCRVLMVYNRELSCPAQNHFQKVVQPSVQY